MAATFSVVSASYLMKMALMVSFLPFCLAAHSTTGSPGGHTGSTCTHLLWFFRLCRRSFILLQSAHLYSVTPKHTALNYVIVFLAKCIQSAFCGIIYFGNYKLEDYEDVRFSTRTYSLLPVNMLFFEISFVCPHKSGVPLFK